jgi:hypothetical protein
LKGLEYGENSFSIQNSDSPNKILTSPLATAVTPTSHPTASVVATSVVENGVEYALLSGALVNGATTLCQTEYLALPDNSWSLASDNVDTRALIAANTWSTDVVVLGSGVGIGTKNFESGLVWGSGLLLTGSSGTDLIYKPTACNLEILIQRPYNPLAPTMTPTKVPSRAPTAAVVTPTSHPTASVVAASVVENGVEYALLSGALVNGGSILCQTEYLALPDNSWSLASDNVDTRALIAANTWSTHVVVLGSGVGIGSKNYNPASVWGSALLLTSSGSTVITYKPTTCNLEILIQRPAVFGDQRKTGSSAPKRGLRHFV